jgi:RimJ/RimL family protein N-acetyltransferase
MILETERLAFRRLLPDDLDALAALYADPDVRRYFPDGTLTHQQTKAELEWFRHGHPAQPGLGLWATIHKETSRFIGRCGLLPWTIDGRPEVELAYLLAPDCWGHGLGSEAARGLADHAFEALGVVRLICLVDPANQASIRVATKIGMTREACGTIDGKSVVRYAMSRFGTGQTYAGGRVLSWRDRD